MEILKNDNNLNIIVNTEQNFKTDLGWQENLIEFENEMHSRLKNAVCSKSVYLNFAFKI